MSVQALTWAFSLDIPPAQKLVLLTIANCADRHGDNAFPGQETLAEDASMCVRSVRSHVQWLERHGHLARVRRFRKNGSRTSDSYVLAFSPNFPKDHRQILPVGEVNGYRQIHAESTGKLLPVQREPSEEPSDSLSYKKGLSDSQDMALEGGE